MMSVSGQTKRDSGKLYECPRTSLSYWIFDTTS